MSVKRLKRLAAILLSCAVVFTMTSATAFASEDTGQQDVSTQASSGNGTITGLTFSKIFKNNDGGLIPNKTFTFTMKPATVVDGTKNSEGVKVVEGLPLKNDTVTITYTSLSKAEQSATFSFELADGKAFDGPYVYRYIVKEVVPSPNDSEYMEYDTQEYTVDVQVNNFRNITSVTNVTGSESGSIDKKPIVFTNTYDSDVLVIKKVVSGSLGNKNQKFGFELLIPELGPNIDLETSATLNAYYEDTATGSKVSAGQVKVGENFPFELADGEQLLVEGVPNGMIYKVWETDGSDYTTNITCTSVHPDKDHSDTLDEKDKVLYGKKEYDAQYYNTPIVNGDNLVVFENIKEYNADTGVRIDVIPYIVIFIIAAAGVSVLIFRKRRKWAG
jgi:pilin isopeptide linkage protein